jgi:hypothetical protein
MLLVCYLSCGSCAIAMHRAVLSFSSSVVSGCAVVFRRKSLTLTPQTTRREMADWCMLHIDDFVQAMPDCTDAESLADLESIHNFASEVLDAI